jgi:hypothetical protein
VSPKFRDGIIEQYLVFILKLGWQPSEIHLSLGGGNVQGDDSNVLLPPAIPRRHSVIEFGEMLGVCQFSLTFTLRSRCGRDHLCAAPAVRCGGLDPWRDLFLKALKARFEMSDPVRQTALEAAMKSLDQGKHYVFEGSTWLEGELFR